jgi:2-isopropylmalate synthase
MVKIAWDKRHYNGRGVSTDVVESSIKAYLAAVNAMEWELSARPGGAQTVRLDGEGA